MTFHQDIIDAIVEGRIASRDDVQRMKAELCEKYGLDRMPSNPEILAEAPEDVRHMVEPILRLKPIRSLSGVSVVAVMASPEKCPHGKCIYCPGGPEVGTAQSYTGKEPAARRAAMNDFDPFRQVDSRLRQLAETGHPVDKIDLIVMGGTFPARTQGFQESFIHRCFDAMNGVDSGAVEKAQELNESARSRCIGMTIETRPDQLGQAQIDFLMRLGMTRVEIGVQTVSDKIMAGLERGHDVSSSIEATARAKASGLKVCYHLMPGLPGADMDSDVEMFRTVFDDPKFRPDMLKIYPTLVLKGTKLYDLWKAGRYSPPDTEYIVELLARVKPTVPEWARIQRIQRDIPVNLIDAGAMKSNARQIVAKRMADAGTKCRCIRCREAGHSPRAVGDEVELNKLSYDASDGTEHFIQYCSEGGDVLHAFARLRIDEGDGAVASLRELRVFGQQVRLSEKGGSALQHKGLGRALLAECEAISADSGADGMRITSGVGVRGYYRRLGYVLDSNYMLKKPLSR